MQAVDGTDCLLQTLKVEFAQHEDWLSELEADVEKFRQELKVEAAERLEQQLTLLKVTRYESHYSFLIVYFPRLSLSSAFSDLTLLVGWQEGRLAHNKTSVGTLVVVLDLNYAVK